MTANIIILIISITLLCIAFLPSIPVLGFIAGPIYKIIGSDTMAVRLGFFFMCFDWFFAY